MKRIPIGLDLSTGGFDRPGGPLLAMAEGLIASHKAAKVDGDGFTLDLIEDALFHVGKRLKKEYPGGHTALRVDDV